MQYDRLYWYDNVVYPSVRLSVRLPVTLCTVAKRYILQQKMSERVNRKHPLGTRFYNLQPLH